jgi:hypothetical protein
MKEKQTNRKKRHSIRNLKKTRKQIQKKRNEMSIIPLEIQNVQGKRKQPSNYGWIQVEIHGDAFPRGFAHGVLLAKEIDHIQKVLPFMVNEFFHISYDIYIKTCRKEILSNIQNDFPEFYEELEGISAGAQSKGFSEITMDFLVAWNSLLSMFAYFKNTNHVVSHRCSAFIACGNATEKGDIVMTHNTHADFITGDIMNVILEIYPTKGNRIIMQTAPGFIASGSDWFLCGSGIIGCETTIGKVNYIPEFGIPYYCRIRQAMQYGQTLDDYVDIMCKKNAGDYACSWLLGDTTTGEIMLFELGLKTKNIQRTKNGIFYGMNSAISPEIREKETTDIDFLNTKHSSGMRNVRLHYLLYEIYGGKINIENAKKIISDHYDVFLGKDTGGNAMTICKHSEVDGSNTTRNGFYPFGSTDAKIVNTEMAKRMCFLGRMGHSCGKAFSVKKHIQKHPEYKRWEPYLKSMPHEPWTKINCFGRK